MARNRKYKTAAIRFGPAIKAFLLCLLIGGVGVGYVWQKDQITRLAKEIKSREVRLEKLQVHNEKQRRQVLEMRNPLSLELRIRDLNLGLVPPQPSQIWRLPEPLPEALPAGEWRQPGPLASREGAGLRVP